MKLCKTYRTHKDSTNIMFQTTSFEKEIPSWESGAGNIPQTPCPSISAGTAAAFIRQFYLAPTEPFEKGKTPCTENTVIWFKHKL